MLKKLFFRIYYMIKIAGPKYFLYKISDKLCHQAKAQKLLYREFEMTRPERYEERLKDFYAATTGKRLNLDSPRTFNEKIQWLKIYDATPLKTQLADKFLVRQWVEKKIGKQYLIPLIGGGYGVVLMKLT